MKLSTYKFSLKYKIIEKLFIKNIEINNYIYKNIFNLIFIFISDV